MNIMSTIDFRLKTRRFHFWLHSEMESMSLFSQGEQLIDKDWMGQSVDKTFQRKHCHHLAVHGDTSP
jgi:hypothetical protein